MLGNIFKVKYSNISIERKSSSLKPSAIHSIVQPTIGRQNRSGSPFGIISTQESNKRSDILNFAHARRSWRGLDQGLHILQELLVTLEPLI